MKISPYSYLPLASCVITFTGLVLFPLFKEEALRQSRKAFLFLVVLTFFWQCSWFFLFNTSDEKTGYLIARIGHFFISYLPFAHFWFISSVLEIENKRALRLAFFTSSGFMAINLFSSLLIEGVHQNYFGFYPEAGKLHPFFLMFVVFTVNYLVLKIYFFLKRERSSKLLAGVLLLSFLTYALAGVDFISNYVPNIYPYGALLVASFTVLNFCLLLVKQSDIIDGFNLKLTHDVEEAKKEIKKQQSKLIQSEKLASIGLVSSGVGHQLGNQINTISTNNFNLERKLEKGSVSDDFLRHVVDLNNKSIDLASKTLRGLDFAVKDNTLIKSISAKEAVENSVILLKGQFLETIFVKIDINENHFVKATEHALLNIFMNLITNTKDELKERSDGVIEFSSLADGEFIHIVYNDNAGGIKEEILDKVSDPFVTTKDEESGTGLGMWVVKEEIENNGGRLTVSNREDLLGVEITLSFLKGSSDGNTTS